MRWIKFWTHAGSPTLAAYAFRLVPGSVLLLTAAFLLFGTPAEEKRVSVYSSSVSYNLPVTEKNGQDYVSLREVFEPLGAVSLKTDGLHWRLRFNGSESEFTAGRTRARVRGQELDLPANFLLENGRGLAPVTSLGILLSRFLDLRVMFHENSRRFFIGDAAVHFTAQINRSSPQSLVVNFTAPVNPMIATEPGKLRMVFTRDPVVPPGSETLTFDSKAIPSATYTENNGAAELTVASGVPLLATFSPDRRTITVTPAPQATRAAPPATNLTSAQLAGQAPSPQPGATVSPQQNPSSSAAPGVNINRQGSVFAVLDASHGGEERGAALGSGLAEKDVTLALARHLRQELAARGLTSLIVRDGDVTLSLDQRASLANAAHPAIYVCLHATSEGSGVRVYTALMPAAGDNRGTFLDWDTAQAALRPASQAAALSVAVEFQKRQVPVRKLFAPLRPLNSVTTAAFAVEVAPPAGGAPELNSAAYQQLVAEAVATAMANMRGQLGAAP